MLNLNKRSIGSGGENLACDFLKKNGFKILARNFTIRGGEIDIIARDGNVLVFVEVKTRHSKEYGSAREAVTGWKLRYLRKAALFYIQKIGWQDRPYRFDLVAIDFDGDGDATIELIRDITYGAI